MARINIWETVVNGSGLPITGASVDVYNARTVVHATVYAAETGPGTLSNPVTTTNGTVPGWVDEGEYDLHVTGVGITTTDKRFNALLGGNPAKAANSITSAEIADAAVGTSEIADGSVTNTELAAASVVAGKIAAAAINNSNLFVAGIVDTNAIANLGVTTGKLAANAVTEAKITALTITGASLAAGAVTAGKIAAGGVSASNQFAAGVVDNTALAALSVATGNVQALAITNAKIANDTIQSAKLNLTVNTTLLFGDVQLPSTNYVDLLSVTADINGTYECLASITLKANADMTTNFAQLRWKYAGTPDGAAMGAIAGMKSGVFSTVTIHGYCTINAGQTVVIQGQKANASGDINDFVVKQDAGATVPGCRLSIRRVGP